MSDSHSPPSMQEVIQRLHDYWSARGCMIWQPYSEKVGAGTMNPATVLRVLGPEPWNVAYVEPSFRADDGRYATNPNRMQMHNQYQVILKPDPGNPQELYLGSLEAIGIDRAEHDIRFVEDNWESPALGAWGLGWEVWLDGQEITQFTYFQQSGGQTLDPVSVEITYGLDRIVMYLQEKRQVWDIDVDGVHDYRSIYAPAEIEHSIYNFELANVERMKMLFDIYHAEAQDCIERGLVIPAHDLVLRQSHTFNLLDARGAVGVTERAKFFADMRNQARAIAELYVAQRQREEYPWLDDEKGQGSSGAENRKQKTENGKRKTENGLQSFLLEIGSEELPPQDVVAGIAQLEEKLPQLLDQYRLAYDDVHIAATTRRLVALVKGLQPRQSDETSEKRGPALDRAYDADGNPTKAAQGFARGQGVDVAELEQRDGYVYATKRTDGQATASVLPELCSELMDGLRWGKTMRWNRSNVGYPRPLRWLVALYGDAVVPFAWADVPSGRTSRGPRWADVDQAAGEFSTFEVENANAYLDAVGTRGIVLERDERRVQIAEQVRDVAASIGGEVPDEPALLDEVTDLVEAPQALLGSFEEKYLELPSPVLTSVMKKHQRYFPVFQGDQMLPNFITVANAVELDHPEVVRRGNEGVIRARYADAEFFYRQDSQQKLEAFTERLATLTFHEQLGSMLDKQQRLEKLAPQIARMLNASADEIQTVERAASLSKSDLVTSMVIEMTSLQGIIGEIYARGGGESPSVAQAIREHYLPRSAGDATPETLPGLALGLADKLDSLIGLFAVGANPTGSADPFGLRRAALGIVNNLLATDTDFNVRAGLEAASSLQPVEVSSDALGNTREFVSRRLQGVLLDEGFAFDVVEAVLAARDDDPNAARRACVALSEMVSQPDWGETFTAYARCARITRNLDEALPLNESAYVEQVERDLHAAYVDAQSQMDSADEPSRVLGEQLHTLQAPINVFFDNVMVNAEDETLRRARLALVQHIAALPDGAADLSKLQGF